MRNSFLLLICFFAGRLLFAEDIFEYDLTSTKDTAAFSGRETIVYNNYDYYKKYFFDSIEEFAGAMPDVGSKDKHKIGYGYIVDGIWKEDIGSCCTIVRIAASGRVKYVLLADKQFEQGIKKTTLMNFADFLSTN